MNGAAAALCIQMLRKASPLPLGGDVSCVSVHRSLCSTLCFPEQSSLSHGSSLLEFQSAILGPGEVLTICSKIKKIKALISSGQHAFSQYKRRNKTGQQAVFQQLCKKSPKSLPHQELQGMLGSESLKQANWSTLECRKQKANNNKKSILNKTNVLGHFR